MAAALWALAIKIAWPYDLERLAEEPPAVIKPEEGLDAEEAQETDGVGEV